MNTLTQAKRAIRLYSNPLASKAQRHHNARQWLRSINLLGNNWILSSNVARKN